MDRTASSPLPHTIDLTRTNSSSGANPGVQITTTVMPMIPKYSLPDGFGDFLDSSTWKVMRLRAVTAPFLAVYNHTAPNLQHWTLQALLNMPPPDKQELVSRVITSNVQPSAADRIREQEELLEQLQEEQTLQQTLAEQQSAPQILKRAREIMSCAICKEIFTRPVELGCGHTLCFECLLNKTTSGKAEKKRKLESSDLFRTLNKCPECGARQVKTLFQSNTPFNQTLELLRSSSAAEREDTATPPSRRKKYSASDQ